MGTFGGDGGGHTSNTLSEMQRRNRQINKKRGKKGAGAIAKRLETRRQTLLSRAATSLEAPPAEGGPSGAIVPSPALSPYVPSLAVESLDSSSAPPPVPSQKKRKGGEKSLGSRQRRRAKREEEQREKAKRQEEPSPGPACSSQWRSAPSPGVPSSGPEVTARRPAKYDYD